MKKNIISLLLLTFLVVPSFMFIAQPAAAELDIWGIGEETTRDKLGFTDPNVGENTPYNIIITVVKYLLGFLGLIAVIFILYGGFKWMTAGGNDDKVSDAKKIIIRAVIGLIIVFAAWVIVAFVQDVIPTWIEGQQY